MCLFSFFGIFWCGFIYFSWAQLPSLCYHFVGFSLTDQFISTIISSTPETLSSISCILLVMLAFVVPVHLHRFTFPEFPWFAFSVLSQFQFSSLKLFPSPVCFFLVFMSFFKKFINFFQSYVCFFLNFLREIFIYLHKVHKEPLKVLFFCCFYVEMFRSCCCRTTMFWWCHIALFFVVVVVE